MKKIYLDVGAHDGEYGIRVCSDANNIVYAFEPTPHMINIIESKTSGFNNYHLIKKAVSDYNGKDTFNVSVGDYGCSSLLEFSEKNKTEWGPERYNCPDPVKIEVDVITLDKFCEGMDLRVLKGLGDRISIVEEGVMEAAIKQDVLYRGQNMKDECVEWLESNNFIITRIENNDFHGNEINIYFKRK